MRNEEYLRYQNTAFIDARSLIGLLCLLCLQGLADISHEKGRSLTVFEECSGDFSPVTLHSKGNTQFSQR